MPGRTDVDRVVDHFPNATAEELIIFVNEFPITFQIPGAVAHCVRIFAEEKGTFAIFVLQIIGQNIVEIGVHPAVNIKFTDLFGVCDQTVVVTRFCKQTAGKIFTMHNATGESLVEVVCHCKVVVPDTAFVTDRPHQDARVIFVPFHHAFCTIEIGLFPIVTVREFVPVADVLHTVRFDVGFVTEVETVFVAELGKTGIVRIVTGTDEIDVVPFENHQVVYHVFERS